MQSPDANGGVVDQRGRRGAGEAGAEGGIGQHAGGSGSVQRNIGDGGGGDDVELRFAGAQTAADGSEHAEAGELSRLLERKRESADAIHREELNGPRAGRAALATGEALPIKPAKWPSQVWAVGATPSTAPISEASQRCKATGPSASSANGKAGMSSESPSPKSREEVVGESDRRGIGAGFGEDDFQQSGEQVGRIAAEIGGIEHFVDGGRIGELQLLENNLQLECGVSRDRGRWWRGPRWRRGRWDDRRARCRDASSDRGEGRRPADRWCFPLRARGKSPP